MSLGGLLRPLAVPLVAALLAGSVLPTATAAERPAMNVRLAQTADSFTPEMQVIAGTRPARVYPRTTVVTDVARVAIRVHEPDVERVRYKIRNAKGRVVRRGSVALEGENPSEGVLTWNARRRGKALPAGRYSVQVSGKDSRGNRGSTRTDESTGRPLKIWVSSEKLVARAKSFRVSPADGFLSPYCPIAGKGGNGCGDPEHQPCGVMVPSELFAGGLSHRSGVCPEDRRDNEIFAESQHHVELPDAVRLTSMRVAFSGAPTVAGEPDLGTLIVGAKRVTSTNGSSGWVSDTPYADGYWDPSYEEEVLAPSAYWRFGTEGTDSFDVATFDLDVRYLVLK